MQKHELIEGILFTSWCVYHHCVTTDKCHLSSAECVWRGLSQDHSCSQPTLRHKAWLVTSHRGGKKRVVCYFLFSESPWFYKHRMLFFKQSSHYVFRTSSIHCWHFLVCIFCKRSHLLLLTVRPVINHCCSGATRSNCQRCELSSPTFHVVTVHVFPVQKAVDSPLKSCCIMQWK